MHATLPMTVADGVTTSLSRDHDGLRERAPKGGGRRVGAARQTGAGGLQGLPGRLRAAWKIQDELRRAGRLTGEGLELPYEASSISKSRKADAQRRVYENVVTPMASKLRGAKVGEREFSDYLYARHTLDPVTRATYQQRGARGETGMTQQRAQQIIQAAQGDPAKLRAMNEAADMLYRAVREARQELVDAGVKSQRAVDYWQEQWGDYWVSLPHNVDPIGNPAA